MHARTCNACATMYDCPSFEAFRALVERCTRYDDACGLWREHDDSIIRQPELSNSARSTFPREGVANFDHLLKRLVIRIHPTIAATLVHEYALQVRNDARSSLIFRHFVRFVEPNAIALRARTSRMHDEASSPFTAWVRRDRTFSPFSQAFLL